MERAWIGKYRREFSALNSFHWLNSKTHLFGIGSCFANNFSRWIARYNVLVATPKWGMHYNPYTILNELKISSGQKADDVIWKVCKPKAQVLYIDGLRHPIQAQSIDELRYVQAEIKRSGINSFQNSNAFIITLGLAEIWEQLLNKEKWVVVNRSLPEGIVNKAKTRNRFLSVAEVKETISKIVDLIHTFKGTSTPIVFSISPIPLKTTSSKLDVQSANIRSKSILLAGLQEYLDTASKNISYFPAYEIFFGGPRDKSLWQKDMRHPHAEAIEFVCAQFIKCFANNLSDFPKIEGFTVPKV